MDNQDLTTLLNTIKKKKTEAEKLKNECAEIYLENERITNINNRSRQINSINLRSPIISFLSKYKKEDLLLIVNNEIKLYENSLKIKEFQEFEKTYNEFNKLKEKLLNKV